jgi:hypothetical protein
VLNKQCVVEAELKIGTFPCLLGAFALLKREGEVRLLSYDGKIMRTLEVVGNYCLLNLLWIVFSLPVITVFPATVAMFGIMKEWTNGTAPPW